VEPFALPLRSPDLTAYDAGPPSAKLLNKAKTRFYPENRKR
jgi:hypothetical protein